MTERINPRKFQEQVREDIEERQRLYRRPRPTPQERQRLQKAVEHSRPDLLATIPAGQSIKILKGEGKKQNWADIQDGSLIMPHRYFWAISREEETPVRLSMGKRGPKKISIFIKGSPSDPPREEEHFLGEVLPKKEEEQTIFKVSPPSIGQIEAGQIIAIKSEIVEHFGYWQSQDGQASPFKPEAVAHQEPKNLKLSGF